MQAFVDRWLYVPLARVHKLAKLKKELTVRPIAFGHDEQPAPIPMYDESKSGYLGVPIAWGLAKYGHTMEIEDRTSEGRSVRVRRLPDPDHPQAGEGQAGFMKSLRAASHEYFAFLAKAGTGTGKTVSALWLAALLGRTTLIIVPSTQLMVQWRKEIKEKLGVSDHHIGVIQQDKCEYDRDFVIASVHTIVDRDFPEEVRRAFGTVVWDEAHRMGAHTFSRSIGMFSSKVKLAMTATDKRRDGADKVYLHYFGEKAVEISAPALQCRVKILHYHSTEYTSGNTREYDISQIARDRSRNEKIVKLVSKLWEQGRYILVIGDSIKHLQNLQAMLVHSGVPPESMGQFTASYYPEKEDWRGRGDRWASRPKKTPQQYLDHIKADLSIEIVFATYGSMKEGQDIPRLDAGVDVTPRSEGAQVIGRTRRRLEGKPETIWYTIIDRHIARFRRYAQERIKDYLSTGNVEIINGEKSEVEAEG